MVLCWWIFIWHVHDNIWFSQSCIRGHWTVSADGYCDTPWHLSKTQKREMKYVFQCSMFNQYIVLIPFTNSNWNEVRSAHIKNMKMYVCCLLWFCLSFWWLLFCFPFWDCILIFCFKKKKLNLVLDILLTEYSQFNRTIYVLHATGCFGRCHMSPSLICI